MRTTLDIDEDVLRAAKELARRVLDRAQLPPGALAGILSPLYMRTVPPGDGWNNPWHVDTNAAGTQYTITSYGADGASGTNSGGPTTDFKSDIIYTNSSFYQWPQGAQQ